MKRAAMFLALFLAAGASQASDISCEVQSNYDLRLDEGRIEFAREDGEPGKVAIVGNRLFVDGREVVLTRADVARISRYSREVHELAPEVQAIALDAVDIAFIALSEVATLLAEDGDETVRKLERARREVERQLRASPAAAMNDNAIDDAMAAAMSELVPALVGDIVKSALVAAFTGNSARAEALEARANRIEREIERRIEPRAKALERRAKHLCDRMAALDGLENDLDYRLPGGDRLDLLRSGSD